jgi:hypothetical protein
VEGEGECKVVECKVVECKEVGKGVVGMVEVVEVECALRSCVPAWLGIVDTYVPYYPRFPYYWVHKDKTPKHRHT